MAKSNPKAEAIFWQSLMEIKDKAQRIRTYRSEASRLASIANKRIERLEKNNLQNTPAYQQYLATGGRFGVKGKTFNEVQSEVSRLTKFINSNTSTISGINTTLKEMAANTGIKYNNLADLKAKSTQFFELASKVEQYLRNVEDMASAIGYQKIWEAINQYTAEAKIDLGDGEVDIDAMVKSVTEAIAVYDKPVQTIDGWYSLKSANLE